MRTPQRSLAIRLLACTLLLPLLQGGSCATPTPNVGVVVVAPKPKAPPVPQVMQDVHPQEAGYFQRHLADYFSAMPQSQTTSTEATPPASATTR